jgi:hypothetical protein
MPMYLSVILPKAPIRPFVADRVMANSLVRDSLRTLEPRLHVLSVLWVAVTSSSLPKDRLCRLVEHQPAST